MAERPTDPRLADPRLADLHQAAMVFHDAAQAARRVGENGVTGGAMHVALRFERRAARMAPRDLEPTRSVLHRSAAWMAIDCGLLAEAKELAREGLDGHPPEEIAEELMEVLAKAEGRTDD